MSMCIVMVKHYFFLLQARPLLTNFDIQLVKKVIVIFSCNCCALSINRIHLASQNTLAMTFLADVIDIAFSGVELPDSTHCFDYC